MSILGNSVLRVEDDGLLTGNQPFTADLITSDTLHSCFIRSPVAHGRLVSVIGGPGLYTAASLELPKLVPWPPTPDRYARDLLVVDKIRYVGDPIAVVTGRSFAEAQDLAGDVEVEIESLPAVVSAEESSEVAFEVEPLVDPSALEDAEVVVEAAFVNQKLAPVPLETNSILVVPDDDGAGLCIWVSTQFPWDNQASVAAALNLDPNRVRVIAPAVGGGFGAKGHTYPEHIVVAALAHRTGQPVAWQETRSENLLNMTPGRGQIQRVALGAKRDGTITGIRVEVIADAGAYPHVGAWLPNYTRLMCTGTYRIPRVDFRARSMVTNTAPVGAYRGAGRPEATAFLERSMDLLARELQMDPVEFRRRNLLESHSIDHVTPSGAVYDSGNYGGTLDRVVELAGYESLRQEQSLRRARGDQWLLGIGVSSYIEVTGNGPTEEFASVAIELDGSATVLCGVSSQGQGHQTTYAQIAAAQLGLPIDKVRVVQSDTGVVPRGNGTYGSRSLQLAGSAVDEAARAVVEQACVLAAERLEANAADMVVYEGVGLGIIGSPATAIDWADLAPLAVEFDFDQGARTYPSGSHISVVEVDRETGAVRMIRHITVDDCGNVINPMLAQGQQHGGIAQGAAQALWEELAYAADGQPMTSTLLEYLVPSAGELPSYEINSMVTPTPLNRLGVKGIGEATTIGSTPAVHNAVLDALAPWGVEHLDMPLSPEKIWRAING
ncbi:MAG: xanthine dehydrogenase family protein molybdopterin-binding subunit [bacterium]|nr:xanthine dehydrogenase family protein molybdopterin-binding subunit [bacterium]